MGYRNPGLIQQVKLTTPQELSRDRELAYQTAKKEREVFLKNQKANFNIETQAMLNSANIAAGLESQAVAAGINNDEFFADVNYQLDRKYQLESKLRNSSSRYEGYEEDVQELAEINQYINGFEQDLAAINYAEEELRKLGTGNQEGQVNYRHLNPGFKLYMAGKSGKVPGVDIKTRVEKDEKTGKYVTSIVMQGEAVKSLNQELGFEGDTYKFSGSELMSVFNDADGDPDNYGMFQRNPQIVKETSDELTTQGVFTKDGRVADEFMVEGSPGISYDPLTNSDQRYIVKEVNAGKVVQRMSPMIKSKMDVNLMNGPLSVSAMVSTYAKQDKEGRFYYDPLIIGEDGLVSRDKDGKPLLGERVYVEEVPDLSFDDPSNLDRGGLTQEQYDQYYKMIENFSLRDMGLERPSEKVPVGEAVKRKEAKPKTEAQIERDNSKKLVDKVIGDFEKELNLGGRNTIIQDIIENLIGKANVSGYRYNDETGMVTLLSYSAAEPGEKPKEHVILEFNINNIKRARQKLYNLYNVEEVAIEYDELPELSTLDEIKALAESENIDLSSTSEEKLVPILKKVKAISDKYFVQEPIDFKNEVKLVPKDKNSGLVDILLPATSGDFSAVLEREFGAKGKSQEPASPASGDGDDMDALINTIVEEL